jgi:hypothetical protein
MMKVSTVARRIALAGGALLALAVPAAASAQLFVNEIVFQAGPMEAGDPAVGIPLPGATPAELRAGMIWNLRAGLNVAALQCQFSPYLRTVSNYNAIIRGTHEAELAAAYNTLQAYFRRVGGARGATQFDQYSTRTYNNFSTLQAQVGFCQTAARIGKDALTRSRGQLGTLALARMRELRSSLVPAYEVFSFLRTPVALAPIDVGGAPPRRDCSRLRGRERRECEAG